MYKTIAILATFFTLAFYALTGVGQNQAGVEKNAYLWMSGKLIPNEFALPDGTWKNASIRECMNQCSKQKACSGFSIKKIYGDAWQSGCKNGMCEEKTECHAKGLHNSNEYWLPNDQQIRVPKVNASSNAWIEGWGTVLKK